MDIKPRIGILTTFSGSDEAYSLVVVVKTQLEMLVEAGYNPTLFVCPSFTGIGIWADNRVNIRKTVPGNASSEDIYFCLHKMLSDIDIVFCHDIVFLSPQHDEWANAVRRLAKKFPDITWFHWQHSRGDHAPIEPVENSEFCYPNEGDLPHVAQINSTTLEHVHYIPHPLDFNYLGWPKLAIKIAEDFNFPFVDVSMIYPSRLDIQKQVEKAVRVFAGLKKAGKSVCLLAADAYATGERFKNYKKDCLNLANSLGLTEKEFAFLGETYDECVIATPRPVVKALFEMSNLFLQTSNSETSSLVVMEAALAGNLIVLNADFKPIHHLYKKALTLPFSSVITPDTKYWRLVKLADGSEQKIEDEQFYFDDQANNLLVPILNSQIVSSVKRQQLRERWPSRIMRDYLEPIIFEHFKPSERAIPACTGDPEVTAIICSLDNLEMLQRQIPILMNECGKIIVVNNGSKDGTADWLAQNSIEGLAYINMPENKGAGIGRNAGLKAWDENPTPYTLMVDGGILPPRGGVKPMKDYLIRHPETGSISPEIASCYTTEEEKATYLFDRDTINDDHCFFQYNLSGTAYCLCRAEAWKVRFSEEGPYGEPGWGVDDNDMMCRWNELGIKHTDFTHEEEMILFRKASGSFKRLSEETGIWPNQYGSVYEKRLVKLYQDYPQYYNMPPIISCVVLGWNEFPMIAKVVKRLHEELKEDWHEVIVIDNGSTDETPQWAEERRLRQFWGDTYIDKDGNIVKRSAENEDTWTGNFRYFRFDENMGTGAGFNKGFEMARGKYIFYICGDMLPVPGSIKALIQKLEEHPEAGYVGVNAWVSQGESEMVEEFQPFTTELNLGNYAYSYAVVRREVYDNGGRFADRGPFQGAGAGYEEVEFAYQMYSQGKRGITFNYPGYFHKRRDGLRSGIEERGDNKGYDERKKWLMTRWNRAVFGIEHITPNPPDKHIRRVAIMNNLVPDHPGPAGYLAMELRAIGCHVEQYNTHDDISQLAYDNYIFVDDGDGNHFDCPEWAHPSKYWAIDMVIPGNDYVFTPNIESYIEHGKTFDEFFATTLNACKYAVSQGLDAYWLPMAASPEIHKHYHHDILEFDWVACWHNCGSRIDYANAAMEKFPKGWVGYAEGANYAIYTNMGRCALNVSRVNEVNLRVMEVMAMKVPLITDRVQGMEQYGFIENEHYLGHSSIEEMLEKIAWVNENPEKAQEMAERAYKLVLSRHTYYHRALSMFAGDW